MLTAEEVSAFLAKDASDSLKQQAREGQRYYDGDHDIRRYRLYCRDRDGHLVEDRTRSNIRISHPFFTELVDQAVQYMLSGKDGYAFSDLPDLQKILDEAFNHNDRFNAELYEALTGCLVKGCDYMYAYRDAEDRLSFQWADSLGIIEVRARDTDDHCDYVIYWYIDRIDKDGEPIRKIQVWDSREVAFFIQEGLKAVRMDSNEPTNPRPHVLYTKGDDGDLYYGDLGFIPFFRLDLNRRRISSLTAIKGIIDDYDLMNCSLSNNLQDLAEGIYVVRNYMGDDIEDLVDSIRARKAVGVDDDGGVDIKTIDIPYEARKAKLALDEDNIYRFGMGFNSQKVGDGNITNIVIKSRYALLDLKCNKLEIQLKSFLRKIARTVLDDYNSRNDTGYQESDIYFRFERETITNALDNAQIAQYEAQARQTQVNTLLSLAERLDDETFMRSVCDVLDIDYEEIRDRLPKSDAAQLLEDEGDIEDESEAEGAAEA